MFYTGTLQAGIADAVHRNRTVLCFVTDGNEESQKWEQEYMIDEAIQAALRAEAVSFRLEAGSEEAGYLDAILPVPKAPAVLIMKNGLVKDYIAPNTSQADFVRRLLIALGRAQPTSPPLAPVPNEQVHQIPAFASSSGTAPAQSVSPPSASPHSTPPPSTSPSLTEILPERAGLHKARREKENEAEKAARKAAEEQAKGKARDQAQASETEVFTQKLKRKQQEERDHRKKILQQIADDKAERKAKAQERNASNTRRPEIQSRSEATERGESSSIVPPASESTVAAIQVRLFDGSTIRSRFPSSTPLQDIRKWIDEERKPDAQPYHLKVLLIPAPSKVIEVGEESKTLRELRLTPSATLVTVPIESFAESYPKTGNAVVAFFSMIFYWIVNFFSSFLMNSNTRTEADDRGTVQITAEQEALQAEVRERRSRGGNIRGLGEVNGNRRDQEFYNGNSVNFQSHNDQS